MSIENLKALKCPDYLQKRLDHLGHRFNQLYHSEPEFFCRAPGRVNLIGEHIDYCGYGVLPMALKQDIVCVVRRSHDTTIRLHNTNSDAFSSFQCSTKDIHIDKNNPKWHKYFLCGVKGIVDHMSVSGSAGFDCLIDGTIPRSAGLSSSSALVCCAALATMHVNRWTLSRKVLAELCAQSERYIGTEGGGMDQAISFLADEGTAKLIEFNPLNLVDVQIPRGYAFVIVNSGVEMNKAATADFNVRVVECRLASQFLAKKKGFDWRNIRKPKDVQDIIGSSLAAMIDEVKKHVNKETYGKRELCEFFGVGESELDQLSLSSNTVNVPTFKLRQRLLHVFSEAHRVYEFKKICDNYDGEKGAAQLGTLMNDSHSSCQLQYECSCPELDNLVSICRNSGALGSRMTGAGWGGCTVSLVPEDVLVEFMSKVAQNYYGASCPDSVADKLFSTLPCFGAYIYDNVV